MDMVYCIARWEVKFDTLVQERIMKKGRGGGKEREAPTHSIEISELTLAAHATKDRHNRKVCSQEK